MTYIVSGGALNSTNSTLSPDYTSQIVMKIWQTFNFHRYLCFNVSVVN